MVIGIIKLNKTKDWHPHGTWHRESNVDGAQGKELHQEAKQYSKQAKEDFRNCD